MRLGFDAKRVFHNFRGLGNYARTLIESLLEYYPQQEYVLFTPAIQDPRGLKWRQKFKQTAIQTPPAYLNHWPSLWRSVLLSKNIQLKNLDIYHGLSHELPWGIGALKIKTLVTIHDLIFMRYPQFFPWIDRQIYRRKYLHSIKNADVVIAICQQTKQDLMEFFQVPEKKIEVVYQACHPSFYNPVKPGQWENIKEKFQMPEHYILYVGALEKRKNVITLIRAFAHLKKSIPHKLALVGEGKKYKRKIQEEILSCNLHDRVLLLGNVPTRELSAIYQKADLFVYPSFFEGWGIPNVEALFSGTPVITAKGSCLHESAGPHSLYTDPYSLEDLIAKMKKVIFDEDLKKTMSVQGRNYAKQFHWSETSQKLMNLYQSLL